MADYQIDPRYNRKGMGWGKRPILLVVDVCKAWITPGSPVDLTSNPQTLASLEVIKKLVEAARKSGVPVAWSKLEYTHPQMADAGLLYQKAKYLDIWHKDDPRKLYEPVEGLAPGPDDLVVLKQFPSAFFGTTLASTLRTIEVDTVIICGMPTSGSIRPTGLECAGLGFRTLVVAAGCTDKTESQHNTNLFDLQAKYADVLTQSEALERLAAGNL